jgi:ABC-2 type transport system permease protein
MSGASDGATLAKLGGPVPTSLMRSVYQTLAVFRLTLRNLILRKRTLFIVLVACVPVLAAVALRYWVPAGTGRPSAEELFQGLFFSLYVYFVIVLTSIFFGASLFADERGERTITFLLIRPIPREAIVVGKFLMYVLASSVMLLASLAVTYSIFSGMDGNAAAFREAMPLLKHARVVLLGVAAYGAVFTLFGAVFKHPVIVGFVYCFVWESILPYLPVFLKKATLMHYMLSLVPGWKSEGEALEFFVEPTPPESALWTLLGICVAFLILTAITLRTKEYKFEKEL